jgi:hypothetical protein
MLPILVTLAAAVQAVDPSAATRAEPVLHTPDAITPAVLPYLACLYAERGLPFVRASDNSQIPVDKSDRNCTATRRRAKEDAVKLLSNKPIPGGVAPADYVENALSDMESYVAALPVRQSSDTSKQPVVGVPITIEDEVEPAYNRYQDCLRTQVSYRPITVETVLTAFQQAITVCQSIRDLASIEAANALVKKGWDAAAAAKAAENTFAAADRSWIERGRQFRDSLLARAKGAKP